MTVQDPKNDNHPDRLHKSRYAKKYPYNQVTVTESGHEFHVDDTPGKERLRTAHKSGTYHEITADGKLVELVVGHHQQYIKGGHTQTVHGNSDVKYGASHRENVSGHRHEEVRGSVSQAIEGNHKQLIGGDSVTAVKGDQVTGVVGKQTTKISGGSKTKIDGSVHIIVDGDTSGGQAATNGIAYHIEVGEGGVTITTEGKMNLQSNDKMTLTAPDIILQGTVHLGDKDAHNQVVVNNGGVEFYDDKVFATAKFPMPPD